MTTPRLVHLADLETIYDDPERVGRLAGAIRDRRDDRTLVVGAGDTTALGALAFVGEEGRQLARPLYEAISPAADTLGNHEFDYGTDRALQWAQTTPGQHLVANVEGISTDAIAPCTIVDVADARIGLVGVTDPRTAEISGRDLEAAFTDPVPAVRTAIDRATATRLVARAYRDRGDAAVGLAARGSVRDGLPEAVTRGDVIGIVPFDSALDVHRVDGRTLEAIVDRCATFDEGPDGEIVAAVDERIDGESIDSISSYRVACMSYLTEVDLVPELDSETLTEDRGPRHEHVLAFLEQGGSIADLLDDR